MPINTTDINYYFREILLMVVPLLLAVWVQRKLDLTYKKHNEYLSSSGLTGSSVARMILDSHGLQHVRVEKVSGRLTDHFDPKMNVIRLSDGVYKVGTPAAIGIAAHECGHAIQYANEYLPLTIRRFIIPITNIGSKASFPIVMLGFVFGLMPLMYIGFGIFLLAVFLQLVTLFVEFDASKRAITILNQMRMSSQDMLAVKEVLNAAALTYVASLASALTQLLRIIFMMNTRKKSEK